MIINWLNEWARTKYECTELTDVKVGKLEELIYHECLNGPIMNNDWKWWNNERMKARQKYEICKAKFNEELTILIEYDGLQQSNKEDKRSGDRNNVQEWGR